MSSLTFISLQAMSAFMFLDNVNVKPRKTAAGTCPTARHLSFIPILPKHGLKSSGWNTSGPQGNTSFYRSAFQFNYSESLFQLNSALTGAKKKKSRKDLMNFT